MGLVLQIAAFLATLYIVVLLGRIVFDWIQMFARSWRPKGGVLVLANLVYALTDPPMKLLRRWLRPVRLGDFSLDLAFLVLFLIVWFLQYFLQRAAFLLS